MSDIKLKAINCKNSISIFDTGDYYRKEDVDEEIIKLQEQVKLLKKENSILRCNSDCVVCTEWLISEHKKEIDKLKCCSNCGNFADIEWDICHYCFRNSVPTKDKQIDNWQPIEE